MARSVLIIGGGVIGLCAAYYARRAGLEVTVVERSGAEHDGCSTGNAGMVVPSHFVPLASPGMVGLGLRMMLNPRSPFRIRPRLEPALLEWAWRFWRSANAAHVERAAPLLRDLHRASRGCYEELAGELGDGFCLVRNGLLMLCRSEEMLRAERKLAAHAVRLGVEAAVLTPEEAARIDPGVEMSIAGAVYFPEDCHLSPLPFLRSLARAVEAGGTRLLWQTEALGWRTRGQRIEAVRTDHGELCADEYVVAAGAWSPGVARELGTRLPIQAGKGYSLTLPRPRQLPTVCSILTEARIAATPMGETLRFAGTMEITGLDRTVDPRRVEAIVNAIPRYFPAFRANELRDLPVWSGLRPCTPDGLPYVGRVKPYSNLLVATGHAMMGMSLGPITGRLIAEILSGATPSLAIDALSPDRYG
jgi:D-amino-acid dehydrogenase